MTIVNYSLNRRMHQALYTLKRAFGNTVKLHKLVSIDTNYTTGVKEVDSTTIVIHRCIILPAKVQREVAQTISIISANKEFVYGGTYDTDMRTFIIDSKDLPKNYIIQNDDWLEFENYRYSPKVIEELMEHTGWLVIAKRVIGPSVTEASLIHEPDIVSEGEND